MGVGYGSNNAKLLLPEEYKWYKEKYTFELYGDNQVAVGIVGYNRLTLHPIDQKFFINGLIDKKPYRKITFTPDAMGIWKELIKDGKDLNLVDVQQAVSKLRVTFQNITKENVLNILEGKDIRIKVEDII